MSTGSRTLATRIGLPPLSGRRGLLAALAVDSIGTGLFLPFAVVYFLHTTSLSLAAIGVALTVARLLSLPVPIAAGELIDRFGTRAVVLGSYLLGAAGFTGYLFVRTAWLIALMAFVVSAGQAAFWTGARALIREIAGPADRPAWFSMLGMTRNAGFGLGGLVAAALASIGVRWVFFLFAGVNAASFVFAAALIAHWTLRTSPGARPVPGGDRPARQRGYLRSFSDRALLAVTGVNLTFVMCANVLNVLLVVYITTTLKQDAWLGGVVFSVNTILVSTAQGVTTRWTVRFGSKVILQLAAVCWAVSFLIFWGLSAAPGGMVLPGLFLAIVVFTLAEMIKEPTINTVLAGISPDEASGRYAAAYQLSWSIGNAFAPAVLIGLLRAGPAAVWIVMLCCCLLAALGTRQIAGKPAVPSPAAARSPANGNRKGMVGSRANPLRMIQRESCRRGAGIIGSYLAHDLARTGARMMLAASGGRAAPG
jgi:MFS family permease